MCVNINGNMFEKIKHEFCEGKRSATKKLYSLWAKDFFFIAYRSLRNHNAAFQSVEHTFKDIDAMPIAIRKQLCSQEEKELKSIFIDLLKKNANALL
jgi:hypothetical protein